MGRWDEALFGGDADMDEVDFISKDAGIDLYDYESLEGARDHLNNGVLKRLFLEYATKPVDSFNGVSKELRYVLLGMSLLPSVCHFHDTRSSAPKEEAIDSCV
jgi:hypothetical protein